MSASIRFHAADLSHLFHVIGSADRDLLREIGEEQGSEFLAATEDEDDTYLLDEEANESTWDDDEDEVVAGREAVVNLIMGGMPSDVSEDEAVAIQEFLASETAKSQLAHPLEPDDVLGEMGGKPSPAVSNQIRTMVLMGVDRDVLTDLIEWLEENGASSDLVLRLQLLCFGRLPEAEDPTFPDIEDAAYEARFGYLWENEIAPIRKEMSKLAPRAAKEAGPIAHIVAAALGYCRAHSQDLVTTTDE